MRIVQDVASYVRTFQGEPYYAQQDGIPYFMRELGALPVIRRVGGLEAYLPARADRLGVIRRVGGLDCQKLRPHSAAGAFVLEHVQGEADADFRLSSPYGIPHSSHIGR